MKALKNHLDKNGLLIHASPDGLKDFLEAHLALAMDYPCDSADGDIFKIQEPPDPVFYETFVLRKTENSFPLRPPDRKTS